MTNGDDAVWTLWTALWRSGVDRPPLDVQSVRERVDRDSVRLRLTLLLEIAVTLAVMVPVALLASRPGVLATGWAVAAAAHTLVVWLFSLWNRRRIWRPLGDTPAVYLALLRQRLVRRREAARFTLGLVGAEVAALAAVAAWPKAGPGPSAAVWVAAAAVTGGAMAWAVGSHRRAVRELARLDRLERELADSPS